MKDKLYSRRRIRLPDLRKVNSFKIILLIIFFTILTCIIIFMKTSYPVLKATCETAAASKGNKIVNDEVSKVMKDYTYEDLINIEKDVEGRITLIKANTIKINEIVNKINYNIQKQFDLIPRITVYMNMGSVSGISVLNKLEPNFEVELESAGTLQSSLRTEFKSVGINQTHHKIYLDIDSRVGILTPFATFGKDIKSEVLLTEAVIVGEVPDSYYNLDGVEEPNETYNFIE